MFQIFLTIIKILENIILLIEEEKKIELIFENQYEHCQK